MHWNANSLYGWAISQKLASDGYKNHQLIVLNG